MANSAYNDFENDSNNGDGGRVSKVASKWRMFEDSSLAHHLQEEEFDQHYELNRQERRQIGTDTRRSKKEQLFEDEFAAEYWAQLSFDREKEDCRIAMKVQQEIEEQERLSREETIFADQELARKLGDNDFVSRKKADESISFDEEMARKLHKSLNIEQMGEKMTGKNKYHSAKDDLIFTTKKGHKLPQEHQDELNLKDVGNVRVSTCTHKSDDLMSFEPENSPQYPTNPPVNSFSHEMSENDCISSVPGRKLPPGAVRVLPP